MYRINGWFPVVRCVCGRETVLRRAQVCECGVTLRIKYRGNAAYPRGTAPDSYNAKAQPYRMIEVVNWEQANGKQEG